MAIFRRLKRTCSSNVPTIVCSGILLTFLFNWLFSGGLRPSYVFREDDDEIIHAAYDFDSYTDYTKALQDAASADGTVVMALVDSGFVDMAYNFYQSSIIKHDIDNFLFVALDHQACDSLHRAFPQRGVKCFVYKELPTAIHASLYDSREFKEKIYLRRFLILQALRLGYDVLLTDLDMVYLQNPMKDVKHTCQKKSCDIAAEWDDHLEKYNAGFVYVRATNTSIKFYHRLAKYEISHGVGQLALNAALREHEGRKNAPRIVPLGDKKYRVGITLFPRNVCPDHKEYRDIIVIHNNYIIEHHNKIFRLKECMLWDWDGLDGYYTDPHRRYLSIRNAGQPGRPEHQTLLNAFAIAKLLKRTVILPRFECKMKGKCNLLQRIYDHSHLHFVKRFHNVSGGNYRESTFLHNPRVPDAVKHSVSPFYRIAMHAEPEKVPATVLTLTPKDLELGPTPKELMHWFGTTHDKILHFDNLIGHYGYLDYGTILGIDFIKVIRHF